MGKIPYDTIFLVLFVVMTAGMPSACLQQADLKPKRACSECHRKPMACHIRKKIDLASLTRLWEESFHYRLQKETFPDCPFLGCADCHPDLKGF